MTALRAKSCSPRPGGSRSHGSVPLQDYADLNSFSCSHLRLVGHEIRKVFAANKKFFCHQGGQRGRKEERKGRLVDGLLVGQDERLKKGKTGGELPLSSFFTCWETVNHLMNITHTGYPLTSTKSHQSLLQHRRGVHR